MRYEGLTISNDSTSANTATTKAAEAATFPLTFPQSSSDDYKPAEAIVQTGVQSPVTYSDDVSKDAVVEEDSSL